MLIADASHKRMDTFQRVHSCLDEFVESNEVEQKSSSLVEFKMKECHERFQLWSSNLGAHRRDHNSLDSRLSEVPKLKHKVLQYLEDMMQGINESE